MRIDDQGTAGRRGPATDPGVDEQVVRERTGRGWEQWCALIDGWWAQQLTVGRERLTDRRLANELADGTFTTSHSATVAVDAEVLRPPCSTPIGAQRCSRTSPPS